jgi:hypothetical protein
MHILAILFQQKSMQLIYLQAFNDFASVSSSRIGESNPVLRTFLDCSKPSTVPPHGSNYVQPGELKETLILSVSFFNAHNFLANKKL